MGFFDSLFSSKDPTNVEVVPDKIWMTSDAKIAGLGKEVVERSKSESVAILLVAHFPDVLARLGDVAEKQVENVPVMAVLASDLSLDIASNLNLDESATIDIIVGERHLLPSVDERLEQFANELPCHCRLSHHLSLEDPMMREFGGDWVHHVLEQLGMTEDEAIESRMVSRRIKQAQQKIEGKASGSSKAESAAEWLEKNCPGH
ncbi:MAG: preprotein translocase subunit SecA [Pirellulaceae bacterium]|nr:preprotein translocase subunit SecA [Pirellulaceae bacterium]MDP6558167.1 preprotein translocase subunit SecA [Pirellulaceae bacterium]